MATLSTIITHCTTHQPVIFDKVKINIGSGYNSLHGNFRAPVSGVYAFSTTLSASSHNQYHVAIVKGNATNEIGYLFADPDTNWHMRSTTVFSHLNSGEEVWVVCLSDSSMQGYIGIHADDFDSHFSGFLVSAA